MKNFIQPGNTVTVAAPTGGIASGAVILAGTLLGVAAYTAAEAADVEIDLVGVFEVPKLSTDVVAVGDALYWDNTNKRLTTTASGNTYAGAATKAAGNGVTTVYCLFGYPKR